MMLKKVFLLLSLALIFSFASDLWQQPAPIEMAIEEGVPPLNDKEPKPKSGE